MSNWKESVFFVSFCSFLYGKKGNAGLSRSKNTHRLSLEPLENRQMLSVTPLMASENFSEPDFLSQETHTSFITTYESSATSSPMGPLTAQEYYARNPSAIPPKMFPSLNSSLGDNVFSTDGSDVNASRSIHGSTVTLEEERSVG